MVAVVLAALVPPRQGAWGAPERQDEPGRQVRVLGGSRAGGVARISWTSRQSEQRGGSTRNYATVIGHHRASRDAWRCLR